jgi:hypothetical protein
MKHVTATFSACLATALLMASATALGSDLLGGRLYTAPDKLYVNQFFEIKFELEITAGCEVEDLRISDFPNNPDLITVGRLEQLARQRVERAGKAVDILRYVTSARCHQPVSHTFKPLVQCMVVERRSSGFFTRSYSRPRQQRLAPFTLKVLPLPAEGRPADFSGAVGTFRLAGKLSKNVVRVGDIITLSLELAGQGWLNDAAMPQLPASALFKSYPTKETSRSNMRVTTEQTLIPQSTNALEIAAVAFNFFNPASGRYEESKAGPFRLTFETAAPQAQTAVRVIDTSMPAKHEVPESIHLERVQISLRNLTPLLLALGGTMAAFFGFFLLRPAHPRWAVLAGVLILAASAFTAKVFKERQAAKQYTVEHRTEARFAPTQSAALLFTLNPGAAVTPLERHDGWLRIDSLGRRGWIPQSSCSVPAD